MSSGQADSRATSPAPFSSTLCDWVAIWFAAWTVCTHVAVASGGNLDQLLAGFGAVTVLSAAVLARFPRRPSPPDEPIGDEPKRSRWHRVLQLAGGAAGVGIAAFAVTGGAVISLWWGVVILLGLAAVAFLLAEPAFAVPPLRRRGAEIALWGLAAFCGLIAIVVHRPDLDDTFYVNVAVAAADFPKLPLLARDTLLGVEDLPLHMPAHRIHTYELWNGALSRVFGIPAIYAFHWVSAGMFGALLPLAHARLFRRLTPRVWPWAVAVLLVVLLGAGETHRWYGNFALVRMWQGKSIFLFVFTPLVLSYALEFALRPSPRRWGLLWAAQTAAVGCSSSAVWAAPACALAGLCCVVRPTPEGLRRFLLGATASGYVLFVGLLLKGTLQGLIAPTIGRFLPGTQLESALRVTLGSGHLWTFGVTSVLVAWACCVRPGLAQRFAIALPLAIWLVLLNPYIDHWVTGNVTGPSFWRSMWSLPVPVLMTLVLIAPLQLGNSRAARAAGGAACVALCAAFLAFVPQFSALSQRNGGAGEVGIRVGRPGPKVPQEAFRWAAALNASVPAGAHVVAPASVSVWVPTFHHHAYPLQARRLYLSSQLRQLGKEDVALRLFMTRYVGGDAEVPNAAAQFARGLTRFEVAGVLLRNAGQILEARAVLERLGYERTLHAFDYEIWVRPRINATGMSKERSSAMPKAARFSS